MKRFIQVCAVMISLSSCKNESAYEKADDAQEAGREFIRASLDGDYDKAKFFLLKDSTNTNVMLLDKWKKGYNKMKEEDKVAFKDASIIALNVQPLNDSTVNYEYSNTFQTKDTTTIKIVRVENEWLVDLKDIH